MDAQSHWNTVYSTKAATSVSWYAPHLQQSLRYVLQTTPCPHCAVIDVGGGESTLVDDLLEQGYTDLTVLDISERALSDTRRRLGDRAASVHWLVANILEVELPAHRYDVWHDRAVFHFLTSEAQRARYLEQVLRALKPGGHAIVGTFGPQGPERCSGLPVQRYSAGELHGCFGDAFQLLDSSVELHHTPAGSVQQFVYCYCRRSSD